MQGKLSDFSPTQILNLVSLSKKSGTLAVDRKDKKASLSFKDGKLIHVSIGQADGSLTSVLQRAGRITEEQAGALSRHADKHGDKQLGVLLIQKGYVQRADIVQAIKRHSLAGINEFANWKEGAFNFEQDALSSDDRIIVPLDLENIIIQLARVQKRDEDLEAEIPSLDVELKFADKSKIKREDLQLSREEWSVIKFVKEGNTIRMIAKSVNMSDKQMRRVVGSLREAGLVELAQRRAQQKMSSEEKEKKRVIVGRLIRHLESV
jgi:hypothetical protein